MGVTRSSRRGEDGREVRVRGRQNRQWMGRGFLGLGFKGSESIIEFGEVMVEYFIK